MMFGLDRLRKPKWTLRDGTRVWLRPIESSDGPLLMNIFAHLSSESRYHRFNRPVDNLTEKQQQTLAAQMVVDSIERGAGWLAFGDAGDGEGSNVPLGGIRYVRLQDRPDAAEMAVTVRDDMQKKGLGARLMAHMVKEARRDGLTAIVGMAQPTNTGVWKLIERTNLPLKRWHEGSDTLFELTL